MRAFAYVRRLASACKAITCRQAASLDTHDLRQALRIELALPFHSLHKTVQVRLEPMTSTSEAGHHRPPQMYPMQPQMSLRGSPLAKGTEEVADAQLSRPASIAAEMQPGR